MGLRIRKFIFEESGQTTTEYILILAVVVTLIMQFKNKLKTFMEKLFEGLNERRDDVFAE